MAKNKGSAEVWEGCWAFAGTSGESALKCRGRALYILDDRQGEDQALAAMRALPLAFEGVEWVQPDVGLGVLASELRPQVKNISEPIASAATPRSQKHSITGNFAWFGP